MNILEQRKKDHPTPAPQEKRNTTHDIQHVIAIASGKGGVGKSTVCVNVARALTRSGYRVGILDADIYGPSIPRLFGVEEYVSEAVHVDGQDLFIPAAAEGIRVMSLGFFVAPEQAMLWRGMMAVNALKQLIHQTQWGQLDYLLIDLPPGTGDIHLSILSELDIDTAVIVSTPQQLSVDDVRRGVEMFRNPQVNVPIAGIVENMAWFTPPPHPDEKYYLFGGDGARKLAIEMGIDFLGELPIVVNNYPQVSGIYDDISRLIVSKIERS